MADFRIDGPITGDLPPRVADFLSQAAGRPVRIVINSPGGSAIAGSAVYSQLRDYRGGASATIEGVAASAASLIAMACRPIRIHGGSFVMIHEPQTAAEGTAEDLRDGAALLDRIGTTYRRAYAERTGLPEARVAEMMAAETWMDAEQAVSLGFADEMLTPLRARASADLSRFEYRNVPSQLTETELNAQTPTAAIAEPTAASFLDITATARKAGLGVEWIEAQATAKATLEQVQAAALDAIAARTQAAVRPSTVQILRDEGDTIRDARAEYVASRILGRPPRGAAERMRGFTLADCAATILEERGEPVARGLAADRIFARLTTSDLPNLLTSGAARAMNDLYPTVRTPLVALAQVRNLPDFRATTLIRLAQHRALDQVREAGEVEFAYPTEAGEPIQLATFANRFAVTRNALINDDLGGLQEWMSAAAQGAAARERTLMAGLLTAGSGVGPTLSDGNPWFHASRNNIGTAAAPSATSLAEAVSLMRALRDQAGNTVFALEPFAIVVSPAREFVARQQVAAIATTTTRADIQPYSLEVIVEPALTGNRWWLACAPNIRRCIAAGYLNGAQTPTIETFEDAAVLGVSLRVTFDVAAAVQDPIGWVTNAGA